MTPKRLLWQSIRALIPTLVFDVGGATALYFVLRPHFTSTSLWPILGASLFPVISNVFNYVRHRSFDIVGLIVLVGLIGGAAGAVFGGSQKLLLLRESFINGVLGVILLISPFVMRKPIGYHVIREFLTANEALPHEHFDILWSHSSFRREVRIFTIAWGVILLGEFVLRGFFVLNMSVAFAIGASPVIMTVLLALAGIASAIWLERAMERLLPS